MQESLTDQSFSKNERLCSKKTIDAVVEQGDSVYTTLFRAMFLSVPASSSPFPAQVAFSVPKRGFKHAVARNLLKRRMREAYRKNKQLLYQPLSENGKSMALIIVYRQNTIAGYDVIEEAVVSLLKKLGESIRKTN